MLCNVILRIVAVVPCMYACILYAGMCVLIMYVCVQYVCVCVYICLYAYMRT